MAVDLIGTSSMCNGTCQIGFCSGVDCRLRQRHRGRYGLWILFYVEGERGVWTEMGSEEETDRERGRESDRERERERESDKERLNMGAVSCTERESETDGQMVRHRMTTREKWRGMN